MIRDPLYREIVKGLGGQLDPKLFERCVTDLLRDVFPTLVPISGGADAGMDGAIADGVGPAYPLVCTTDKSVIRNLTKSLDSYLRHGAWRRQIVLVTSQELTPRKRRNLEAGARNKGFVLLQIYEREAVADRLYDSPRWCRELLGLTGIPSALSAIPPSRRPLLGGGLVGRQEDLDWLRRTGGDLLLVGPPGSGKTFLLRSMALEGGGLFLASDDLTEVANAVRAQKPVAIFVDDAHLNPACLVRLRQLREQIGAEFVLIATAWAGAEDEVVEALHIAHGQVRTLQLLSRDDVVEVVNGCGVRNPVELVREIVDQAEGRPGLAVSLAYLCLQGGIEEVIRGDALKRSTLTDFGKLVGEEATHVLAAFAVGGDGGMKPSVVASALEMPLREVRMVLTRLAAGGVIDQARHSWVLDAPRTGTTADDEPALVVRPEGLRYALVRDVFFDSVAPLPIDRFLDGAPEAKEAAHTLVRAAGFGAPVPTEMLTLVIERSGAEGAWAEFAALGEDKAKWVIEQHPEALSIVAEAALERAPVAAIPRLLALAAEDKRPQNLSPGHPLRRLDNWVHEALPETGQAVLRRRQLLEGLADWNSDGEDEVVGQVIGMVMSPAFNAMSVDPGAGRTLTMTRGLLNLDELRKLQGLWPRALDMLRERGSASWNYVFDILHGWSYPGFYGSGELPAEIVSIMHGFARRMLADVVAAADGDPGVLHRAMEAADNLGWELRVDLDPEFEVLFPTEDLDEDFDEQDSRQAAAAAKLADEWQRRDPAGVARRIQKLETAAKNVGHTHPRKGHLLGGELAKRVESVVTWARSLLEVGSSSDLLFPFLSAAVTRREHGWGELLSDCLDDPALAASAMGLVLTISDPPEALLDKAIDEAQQFARHVETVCRGGGVSSRTMVRLLGHEDVRIAAAAAVGEWYSKPVEEVRRDLEEVWRKAILGAPADDHMMRRILESDATLAQDWLLRRVGEEEAIVTDRLEPAMLGAISTLGRDQRLSVLRAMKDQTSRRSLTNALIGGDLQLYEEFLRSEELGPAHLWPLEGKPAGSWAEKAKLALEAGFAPERVARASYSGTRQWAGNESDMWRDWADRFRALMSHAHSGVREVARAGIEYAEQRRERALATERLQAVYGRRW